MQLKMQKLFFAMVLNLVCLLQKSVATQTLGLTVSQKEGNNLSFL